MNFLLILAALALEFSVTELVGLRSPHWSNAWAARVTGFGRRHSGWRPATAVTIILGVPLAVAALILALLFSCAHLAGHLGSLFVLLWMLGPADLVREIAEYRRNLGLPADARATTGAAFSVTTAGIDFGAATGAAAFDDARADLAALALSAERGWFAPVFWFALVGPLGAVLYRLCANLERSPELEPAASGIVAHLHETLAWLPGRITALCLGIAGTLVPVLAELPTIGLWKWGWTNTLVARAALAAIDHGRSHDADSELTAHSRLDQMQALIKRALIVWLAVLALGELLR